MQRSILSAARQSTPRLSPLSQSGSIVNKAKKTKKSGGTTYNPLPTQSKTNAKRPTTPFFYPLIHPHLKTGGFARPRRQAHPDTPPSPGPRALPPPPPPQPPRKQHSQFQ